MKRKILIILSLIVLNFNLTYSQDYWEIIETPDSSWVKSFEIAPDGTLFLGMGNQGYDPPGGIYRSFDDGQSWEYLAFVDKNILSIEFDINGDLYCGTAYGRIYKSTDFGETWEEVYNDIMHVRVIKSHPNGFMFAGGDANWSGILRSTDFGETWDYCFVFPNSNPEFLASMTISPEGIIYAGSCNDIGPSGMYRSFDDGDTWEVFDIPCWGNIESIGVHPSGDLFAGTVGDGVYRYHFDTGQWTHDLYNVSPKDFLFLGNDTIYVGCLMIV